MTYLECDGCKNHFLNEEILTCPKCKDVYDVREKNKRNNRVLMLLIILLILFYIGRDIFLFFFN